MYNSNRIPKATLTKMVRQIIKEENAPIPRELRNYLWSKMKNNKTVGPGNMALIVTDFIDYLELYLQENGMTITKS